MPNCLNGPFSKHIYKESSPVRELGPGKNLIFENCEVSTDCIVSAKKILVFQTRESLSSGDDRELLDDCRHGSAFMASVATLRRQRQRRRRCWSKATVVLRGKDSKKDTAEDQKLAMEEDPF